MLSQRTITVGGDEFVLQQFPATTALRYGIAVGKMVGSMLAGGLDGEGALGGDGEFNVGDDLNLGGIVRGLLGQLDEVRTPELIKNMLKDAIAAYTFEGQQFTAMTDDWYEARFAGALEDIVELLAAIVEDNFLKAILAAKKKMPQAFSGTSSDAQAGTNGSAPKSATESTDSFFGP